MKRAMILLVLLAIASTGDGREPWPSIWSCNTDELPRRMELSIKESLVEAHSVGSQASIRELVGYGFTPHLTLSFTLPVVVGDTRLPPTRIQPGDDFDSTLGMAVSAQGNEGRYSYREHRVRWSRRSRPTV